MRSRFSWRRWLSSFHPSGWESLYMIIVTVIGAGLAIYIAGLWITHIASSGSWSLVAITCLGIFLIVVTAWLGFAWAAYLLAVFVGLVFSALTSGSINILMP